MEKQMTGVEWLETRLPQSIIEQYADEIKHAKKMEKNNIINAYATFKICTDKEAEEYYENLFNKK